MTGDCQNVVTGCPVNESTIEGEGWHAAKISTTLVPPTEDHDETTDSVDGTIIKEEEGLDDVQKVPGVCSLSVRTGEEKGLRFLYCKNNLLPVPTGDSATRLIEVSTV